MHLSFLCPCVPIEVDTKGGMGSVMSPTQGRTTEALCWLLLVPQALLITSLYHMAHWQNIQKKNYLLFCSVILLLPDGHP